MRCREGCTKSCCEGCGRETSGRFCGRCANRAHREFSDFASSMDAQDYTGHESDPNQRVKVWQLTPALGSEDDRLWFQTRDEALEWIAYHFDAVIDDLTDNVRANGHERGSIAITLERVWTTAKEATAGTRR